MYRKIILIPQLLLIFSVLTSASAWSAPLLKRLSPEEQAQQNNEMQALKAANESNALMMYDLTQQIETLKMEMQTLRGTIEEQSFQIEKLKKAERERYSDIDQRILNLQSQITQQPVRQSAGAGSTDIVSGMDEEDTKTYNSAKQKVDNKEFNAAIAEFTLYLEFFPEGKYVAQANYWMGELYRSLEIPENDNAKKHYLVVVEKFPEHSKVPGSLYKLGLIAMEEQKNDQAKKYFEQLVADFPSSSTAALAKNHLNTL